MVEYDSSACLCRTFDTSATKISSINTLNGGRYAESLTRVVTQYGAKKGDRHADCAINVMDQIGVNQENRCGLKNRIFRYKQCVLGIYMRTLDLAAKTLIA